MAHYDLGNDFYRRWLDPTMSYSAALYSSGGERSMASAQLAKYRRILRCLGCARRSHSRNRLRLGRFRGNRRARSRGRSARRHPSPSQLAWAEERLRVAGLDGQVRLELRDYRDLSGEYDHIVSIEMFEAVGERWWNTYFGQLSRLLKPEGRALIQTITIRDDLFARYRRGPISSSSTSFRGMLPSPAVFARTRNAAGWPCATPSPSGRTMRAPWPAGWPPSMPHGRKFRARASMNPSAACGASISPTARRDSGAAAPTSTSSN